MTTNIYTNFDLATYDWIEIKHTNISTSVESTGNPINKHRLVAKWLINNEGKLYCSWLNS